MRALDRDLWVAEAPLRFIGLEVGARMTVVRAPEQGLLLISPIRPDPALVDAVQRLGTVTSLIAPNRFHHLFVGEWKERFPNASIYVAPGLEAKRPDLAIAGVLSNAPEAGWSEVLDQLAIEGVPLTNEFVFFHRSSATLIATDLAFNMGAECPPFTRWVFRLSGAYGRLAHTPIERLMVRDREAFARSLERVLEWPFERIVVAHGNVLEAGGREELARVFGWVLH